MKNRIYTVVKSILLIVSLSVMTANANDEPKAPQDPLNPSSICPHLPECDLSDE